MVEAIPSHGNFCEGPKGWGTPLVCKEGDAGGRANPIIFNSEHRRHPDWDRLFTVWEVVLHVRERDVGKRKDRAQNIGFPQAVEEVWERQGSVGRSIL